MDRGTVKERVMKIYLLLGHPDGASFNGALADAYEEEARAQGHAVRRQDLGALAFDPVLHHGYGEIQPLEPDLRAAQANIEWCEHWVVIYPVWWGSVPALLKGFFDRVLLPEFAFRYHDDDPMWDKLLKGRSGHVITTSDGPNLWTLLAYRNSDIAAVKTATMGFCGFKPVKVTRFGRIKDLAPAQREAHIASVRAAARRLSRTG